MNAELLRDEALALVRVATDYIAECERRGVPKDESERLRDQCVYVLRWACE